MEWTGMITPTERGFRTIYTHCICSPIMGKPVVVVKKKMSPNYPGGRIENSKYLVLGTCHTMTEYLSSDAFLVLPIWAYCCRLAFEMSGQNLHVVS
jgi:hypothetical protein